MIPYCTIALLNLKQVSALFLPVQNCSTHFLNLVQNIHWNNFAGVHLFLTSLYNLIPFLMRNYSSQFLLCLIVFNVVFISLFEDTLKYLV